MSETAVIYRELNLRRLRNVTVLILYAILAFYFLVNGEQLFPHWTGAWTMSTIVYLVGVGIFLGVQEQLPQELESSMVRITEGFLVAFICSTALFMLLLDMGLYFHGVSPMPVNAIVATLIFQGCIVVCSEEIIFRGVIFRFIYQFHWLLAVVLSAVLFSLFHLAVYEFSVAALSTAFFMGIVLAWCVKQWNIGVAIGIHFAWNAFVLGATALI